MPEQNKDKQLFTVARVFFLLIVIPLSLMAILIANGIFKLGITAKERAVTVLDQKSQEEIKIRAMNTADEIAGFLMERKKDLLVSTIIPATEASYKQFVNENTRNIWLKSEGRVYQESVLLYVEMALIDKNGKELIKISNGHIAPAEKLVNISNPADTTYKSEDYFSKTKALNKGEIYVSPVTGWHVNRQEFEQGKRFFGVIRLCTPLFTREGFAGIVELALDYRHLAGFTDHIIPTQAGYVFEVDASTGNYAYVVDNRGCVISHPYDFHICGLFPDGNPVPPLTQETASDLTKKGQEVLNLNLLSFIDPTLPEIAKEASMGRSGVKNYQFGGHTKFVAYAPIKFYTTHYPKPGGFGWVGMGVDVEKWNELAVATSQKIESEAKAWTTTIILILIASVIILFLISALLAKGISRSIDAEVPEESKDVADYYDDDEDDDTKD